jgi:N-methylhydantoinase A
LVTERERSGARLGIDVGGTFVDFALAAADGTIATHKVLAHGERLVRCVLDGLAELAALRGATRRQLLGGTGLIVHGTTVATNAVLTHTGARTALLTTEGTRDALEMRRGVKELPLDNRYTGPPPLVPRTRRFGLTERLDASGEVEIPLEPGSLEQALVAVQAAEVDAVAICLMHAYARPEHELAVAGAVAARLPGVFVTSSAELMPQVGYYARTSTTVLNSYVGPLLRDYLTELAAALGEAGHRGTLLIMNSNGGVMPPAEITRRAAAALASGPAAGPVAGSRHAAQRHRDHCVVIDMGGTSLDISLVADGLPLTTTEGVIGRYRLSLPMVDVRTLAIGGGSIAWADRGGMVHVGPQSAGASPGPACYGNGGLLPTCTDANVALGYIDPDYFAGGRIPLDAQACQRALDTHLAAPLGISVEEAAGAVFAVVNAAVAAGIRDMLVDHGLDPVAMPLVIGGGAAGIHAGAVAAELGLREVIIPGMAGVLCAGGMLATDLRYDDIRSLPMPLADLDPGVWAATLAEMVAGGERVLGRRPDGSAVVHRVAVDLRYTRQLDDLTVELDAATARAPNPAVLRAAFESVHEHRFGYSLPEHAVEIVNLRLTTVVELDRPDVSVTVVAAATGIRAPHRRRAHVADGRFAAVPVHDGAGMAARETLGGPAVLELAQTTIVVSAGATLTATPDGDFVLTPGDIA